MTECADSDRLAYQQNVVGQRHTHLSFKYLKSQNKDCNLPQVPMKDGVASRNTDRKVKKMSLFLHSVFAPKNFNIKDNEREKPLSTNFSISKKNLREILATLDNKKARGPDGLPPIFYPKSSASMADILHGASVEKASHLEDCGCYVYF